MKENATGPLFCNMCSTKLPLSCDKIKIHYSKKHRVWVDAFIGYPDALAAGGNPTTDPSSTGLNGFPSVAMDVDIGPADDTPEDYSVGDGLIEPEDDSPDSWDVESIYSDCSDDMLESGQEDPVVPSSFTLPSSTIPPADDEDENSTLPLDGSDLQSQSVYGSGSKCPNASGFPRSNCLLVKC
jgi:hypothetical protein